MEIWEFLELANCNALPFFFFSLAWSVRDKKTGWDKKGQWKNLPGLALNPKLPPGTSNTVPISTKPCTILVPPRFLSKTGRTGRTMVLNAGESLRETPAGHHPHGWSHTSRSQSWQQIVPLASQELGSRTAPTPTVQWSLSPDQPWEINLLLLHNFFRLNQTSE